MPKGSVSHSIERVKSATLAAILATVLLSVAAGTASAAPANDVQRLVRTFTGGLVLTAGHERDMRHCDSTGDPGVTDCDRQIQNVKDDALLWMRLVVQIPTARFSPAGMRLRNNIFQTFDRYFLAAAAFEQGHYAAYVSQLRQAITQAAAAANRLGMQRWFDLTMVYADCGLWRGALLIPGENPCT